MARTGSWRLLLDAGADGVRQMATDAAILQGVVAGESPATLRLYRFVPRCVTLGRFQDAAEVDAGWCDANGVTIARRPTGGRGVLHADELTYSVIAGVAEGIPRGVAASYRHLCAGLVETYRQLGMDAELTARERGDGRSGACYLHATAADLSVGVAKLSGSAQVWHDEVVLQHGSLVRTRDPRDDAAAFRLGVAERERLVSETLAMADALGRIPDFEEIVAAATGGFSSALGIDLIPGRLTQAESGRIEGLLEDFAIGV